MVSGLLDQLQIFWQLCLIELLELWTGLELLDLQHLIYPRLSTEFDMLVFFTNLGLKEFKIRYLALFLLFSVISSFGWFSEKRKNFMAPFLWIGFNCLKARITSRRQFTFYHFYQKFWYSFYWHRKDERLSRPWSYPVVLNAGSLDWGSSALTTKSLFLTTKPLKVFTRISS